MNNNKQPKISIIIPIYNVGRHLKNTLCSIVNQTLKELEFVCVDDYSTDNSPAILKSFADKDPRFRIIRQEKNKGTCQARKDGVLASTGKYILFLDGDDSFEPETCEELYQLMEVNQTDVLHFGTNILIEDNMTERDIRNVEKIFHSYDGVIRNQPLCNLCFAEKQWNSTLWDKMYKSEIVKKAMVHVEDGHFIKGEDLYAAFILSIYASSYSSTSKKYYNYGYGIGITGKRNLSLKVFEVLNTQATIINALKSFLLKENIYSAYKSSWDYLQSVYLNDCIYSWTNHLAEGIMEKAYELMISYWGSNVIIPALADRNSNSRIETVKGLIHSPFFQKKQFTEPIKNIGIFYYRMRNGGLERVISLYANRWVNQGYNITIFTDEIPSKDDYPLHDSVKRVVLPPSNVGKYEKRYTSLSKSLVEHHIDAFIYHAWISPSLLWDMLTVKEKGVPFIVNTHSFFGALVAENNRYMKDLTHIYQMTDALITLSEADRYFWKTYAPYVVHIPNPPTFDLPNQMTRNSLDYKNIIWVGRISAEKNLDYVIDIFSKVLLEEPEAKLFLVGGAPNPHTWSTFQHTVNDQNLFNNIVLCGFHKHVEYFYELASVFLMTSNFEGSPMTLKEAQYYNLPVVMFDLPYLDSLRNGKGIIPVPHGDTQAAADELIQLLHSKEKRAAQGALSLQNLSEENQFDVDGVWQEVFNSLSTSSNTITLSKQKSNDVEATILNKIVNNFCQGIVEGNSPEKENKKEIQFLNKEITFAQEAIRDAQQSISFRLGKSLLSVPRIIIKHLRGQNKP